MIETKEKIKLLVALQEKDNALDKSRTQAQAFPEEIERLKQQLEQTRNETGGKKGILTQLQLKRKEKEIELEAKENEIKKHNTELNTIKSNDAYRALLNEIAQCKQQKSSLENEVLEIMEAIENESVQVKEDEKKLKQLEAETQSVIGRIENEHANAKNVVAALENERNEFAKSIPEDILRHYEHIRESRGGVAIVPIEGETCGGCHFAIRPQMINDVIKDQEIVLCDSCSRILYKK
jgi:predicted  nucleic acid-binding Zn-ribbon protein